MRRRTLLSVAAVGVVGGSLLGLSGVGVNAQEPQEAKAVLRVVGEAPSDEDRTAARILHPDTVAMLDPGSVRFLARAQDETWVAATRQSGKELCLIASVGPPSDQATGYTCASPDDVADMPIALAVRRRSDPRQPLEGYGGVLAADGWTADRPIASRRAALVLFDDVNAPSDVHVEFQTPDGRRVNAGFDE